MASNFKSILRGNVPSVIGGMNFFSLCFHFTKSFCLLRIAYRIICVGWNPIQTSHNHFYTFFCNFLLKCEIEFCENSWICNSAFVCSYKII